MCGWGEMGRKDIEGGRESFEVRYGGGKWRQWGVLLRALGPTSSTRTPFRRVMEIPGWSLAFTLWALASP